MSDEEILRTVIQEGQKGRAPHLFGAAVVKDSEILAIAHNEVWDTADPSAHTDVREMVSA